MPRRIAPAATGAPVAPDSDTTWCQEGSFQPGNHFRSRCLARKAFVKPFYLFAGECGDVIPVLDAGKGRGWGELDSPLGVNASGPLFDQLRLAPRALRWRFFRRPGKALMSPLTQKIAHRSFMYRHWEVDDPLFRLSPFPARFRGHLTKNAILFYRNTLVHLAIVLLKVHTLSKTPETLLSGA